MTITIKDTTNPEQNIEINAGPRRGEVVVKIGEESRTLSARELTTAIRGADSSARIASS